MKEMSMMRFFPLLGRACALAGVLAGLPAAAQAYPDRPVTLVVPFGPGGNTDIVARMLQQSLAESLGATIVVDNKAGAGGAIGMAAVKRAAPDGYTLAMSVIGPEVLQPALRDTGYTTEDFDHICGVYDVPLMMMVKPDSPLRTVADVVQEARTRGDALRYGSSGQGTILHLSMAMLLQQAGAQALHVPYKSSGEMVVGLQGGQVQVFNETPAVSTQYQLRGLGVFAPGRLAAFPDVPTLAEQGHDLQASVWGGLVAPRGLPPPVRQRLEQACRQALDSEAYRAQAARLNTPAAYRDGAAYAQFAREEARRYGELIRAAGLPQQ